MAIAIKKQLAIADDIDWGVGNVEQERLGVIATYEQINAKHIPYSATESLFDKIQSLLSGSEGSYISALDSEASRRTAVSYATEPVDTYVNVWTSNGDGSFTYTPQTGIYSALHYESNFDDRLDIQNWIATASMNTAISYATEVNEVIVWTSNGDGAFTQTVQTGVRSAKTYALELENVVQGLRDTHEFVSTEGQTTFTLTYTIGTLDVYVEGIKLVEGASNDYIADNGTNVLLNVPLSIDKNVSITAWGNSVFPTESVVEW